ncbi:hypothetical protein RND81_07G047100 [Saponaria officinalis]|uniref:Uncharacterized protein n=1 Tax=Saponaria officinalis TaxID=3572 RepID=A0AAW1JKE2_SAPOF
MDGSVVEDALENRVPGVVVELRYSDDKENAPNTDDIRKVNENILSELKSKVKKSRKFITRRRNLRKKTILPPLSRGEIQEKPKPTNHKPFRLRIDVKIDSWRGRIRFKQAFRTTTKLHFRRSSLKYQVRKIKWTAKQSKNLKQ